MEHVETVIIGAGQAGLSTAYHLTQKGRDCVVLDRNQRIGDGWRQQWDSLRLYSPAKYDGLPGMPFPAEPVVVPGQGRRRRLPRGLRRSASSIPVRLGVRVARVSARGPDAGDGFVVDTDTGRSDLRQRRRRHRHVRADADGARLRQGPRPVDPAAALERVPPSRPAPRRPRPGGRRLPLRHATSPTRRPRPGRPRWSAATAARSRSGSSRAG